ncbi:MAG: hypothetical protein Q7T55_06425 [Solirubrobacteraceae bacterium]|nr:hypothetical protein [Solirubrobacteraceae bacterium]
MSPWNQSEKTPKAKTPKARTSPLGSLLDVAVVEPDGLIVTTSGDYVRLVEIGRVPNLFFATDEQRARTIDYWTRLCGSIPNQQELWFFVLRNPLPPELVSAPDVAIARRVADRDMKRVDDPLHEDMARMRLRLERLTARTVSEAATGDMGASWARHYAAVVWRPQPGRKVRDQAGYYLMRGGKMSRSKAHARSYAYTEHYNAALASRNLALSVAARLSDSGAHTAQVDGVHALSLLWERLHPAAGPHPHPERLADVCSTLAAGSPAEAARARAVIVDELVAGMPEYEIPEAELDLTNHDYVRHSDGTLEETLWLAKQPATADPWWLDPLSQTALASTLAVRIRPEDRSVARVSTRTRVARQQVAIDGASRPVSREQWKVLDETETVNEQLQSEAGATVFKVSVYLSLRCTWGDSDALETTADKLATDYRTNLDATLMRGRRLGARGLLSSLPIASDRLKRVTKWAYSDMGHLTPLSSSRCGHDRGMPLGFAWPHATLERLDLFDRKAGTFIVGITGKGGHGKTLTANVLAARATPPGMRLRIIDRSTVSDEDHHARTGGHYDALLSLIPGSARVAIGTRDANASRLNPWDVDDVTDVHDSQISFLATLHDLLIGDVHGANSSDRRLDATDKAIVTNAITDVYELCAQDPDLQPTESLLVDRLKELYLEAFDSDAETDLSQRIRSLLVRLQAYAYDGPLSFLMDEPTTIPRDAPAIVFDTTGVPKERLAAVQYIVLQAINTEAERLFQQRRKAGLPAESWQDRLMVIVEEIWHLTDTEAGHQMLKEWARRGRHLYMVLVWVTQFLNDLDSAGGRGLLGQTSTLITHFQDEANVAPIAASAGLTANDIANIGMLRTRPGEFSEAFVKTNAGRGKVRMAYAAPEFWALAQDPEANQPVRAIALERSGGDPWKAIELLADPESDLTAA